MADSKLIKTSLKEAIQRAIVWLRIGRAVLFLGSPGLGKSAALREELCVELAKFHDGFDKLPVLLDLRLSYREGVDLRGYGKVDDERGTTRFYVPDEFPTEGPGVIFIDEITQGEKSATHSAYQLILEKRLAEYVVPEGVYIVAAGNRPEDGCGLRKFDSGLRQRFAYIPIEPSAAEFREWAVEHEVNEAIIAATFIYPELIEGFDGKINEQQSTGRELVDLSKAIAYGIEDDQLLGFACDVIGEVAAIKLQPFVSNVYEGLIPLRDVYSDPSGARVPNYDEFDVAIAVTVALAKNVKAKDVANTLRYVDRLESQFRALFAKTFPLLGGDKAIRAQAWEDWTIANKSLTLS